MTASGPNGLTMEQSAPLAGLAAVEGMPTPVMRTDLAASGLFIVARDVSLVLLYWWLATGLTFLMQRDPVTRLLGVGVSTALSGYGWWLVVQSRDEATPRSALRAFLGAALLWAWPATLLYSGLPAGPADAGTMPLPFETSSLEMALAAVRATIVNDVIGVGVMAVLFAITHRTANRMALWSYLAFWLVLQSAKINIFFGVAHAGGEFLPVHLRYLERFFGPAENSPLLGATIVALAVIAALLGWRAVATRLGYVRHSLALLVSLLVLAIVEHLVLGGAFQAPLWKVFLDVRGY
jgi:putative photosynthetic complex assembly protein 2